MQGPVMRIRLAEIVAGLAALAGVGLAQYGQKGR